MARVTLLTLAVIAGLIGGWEWALVAGFALLVTHRITPQTTALLAAAAPGLVWVALFEWTGDRRLFFPYTMQYAVQLACLLKERGLSRGLAAAGSVLTLFFGVRIAQMATRQVLAVEFAVAVGVLSLALAAAGNSHRSIANRMLWGTLSSLLAFLGLFV